MTTRGFKESEMRVVGESIAKIIDNHSDKNVIKSVKRDILELCKDFPLYPDFDVLR